MCLSISNEIKNGNITNALILVKDLAILKPTIKIIPDEMIPLSAKWNIENCELTKINIEDSKESTEIEYYLNNYSTILELKQKVIYNNSSFREKRINPINARSRKLHTFEYSFTFF